MGIAAGEKIDHTRPSPVLTHGRHGNSQTSKTAVWPTKHEINKNNERPNNEGHEINRREGGRKSDHQPAMEMGVDAGTHTDARPNNTAQDSPQRIILALANSNLLSPTPRPSLYPTPFSSLNIGLAPHTLGTTLGALSHLSPLLTSHPLSFPQ